MSKKRLSKSDYLMTYMIIISLACFIGGFFLGANVMQNKLTAEAAAKEAVAKEKAEKEKLYKEKKLYKEQDFVSFYYGVYVPMKSFKNQHFYYLASMWNKKRAEQVKASEKMSDFVQDQIAAAEKISVPASSPLLVEAKTIYLRSLKSYQEGINRHLADQNEKAFSAKDIAQGKHLQTANGQFLQAQSSMYKAVATWEEIYVTQRSMPVAKADSVTIEAWKSYPFHFRNYLAAEYMRQNGEISQFNPEDLTTRLDDVIDNQPGTANGWKDIPFAVNVLYVSDAVRSGDFKSLKKELYPSLKTPEMPIFTE
ncbi:hypothetical protein [Brevibacillus dissolubilis]|uniref:hypothetical protein n=1 Tax=Brevibacillus dissolubilis TaxID=1844116 RepID=UPI001116BB90|nr:hypothetical protein [Brevibacillus dissolubilis]